MFRIEEVILQYVVQAKKGLGLSYVCAMQMYISEKDLKRFVFSEIECIISEKQVCSFLLFYLPSWRKRTSETYRNSARMVLRFSL